jgi:hypothetical protein
MNIGGNSVVHSGYHTTHQTPTVLNPIPTTIAEFTKFKIVWRFLLHLQTNLQFSTKRAVQLVQVGTKIALRLQIDVL